MWRRGSPKSPPKTARVTQEECRYSSHTPGYRKPERNPPDLLIISGLEDYTKLFKLTSLFYYYYRVLYKS